MKELLYIPKFNKLIKGLSASTIGCVLIDLPALSKESDLDPEEFNKLEACYYFIFFGYIMIYRTLNQNGYNPNTGEYIRNKVLLSSIKMLDKYIKENYPSDTKNKLDFMFSAYEKYSNKNHHDIKKLTQSALENIYTGNNPDKGRYVIAFTGVKLSRDIDNLFKVNSSVLSIISKLLNARDYVNKRGGPIGYILGVWLIIILPLAFVRLV